MVLQRKYSVEETINPQPTGSGQVNIGSTERMISAFSGALLTFYAIRRPVKHWALLSAGGYMLYRGLSGYCPMNQAVGRNTADKEIEPLQISRTITVNRPRSEVYAFWRQLDNLPRFMQHLASVTPIDTKRSHWVAAVPKGLGTIEWDAEILEEVENERLLWRSVADATVDNAGEVYFKDAPGGRGTEIHAIIRYQAPAGYAGQALASLFNPAFGQMVKEDLRRFKSLLETGELPVSEAQYSGQRVSEATEPSKIQETYESPVL